MPLTANFIADFSSFINAAKSATASTDELVAAAGKVGATLDQAVAQAATSLRTVGAGIAEFGKQAWSVLNSQQLRNFAGDVTTFVSGYVSEFSKAEQSNVRLKQSLIDAGLATPAVIQAYEDMATSLSKVSTFSDSAIKDAIALFTTVGKVGPEAMKSTLEATMNLAAFWQTDLVNASNILIKAAASDGEALGRLKTILGDSYVPGMNFAQMMDAINTKFAGQYTAQLNTAAGHLQNIKNQMSSIDEVIGKQLNKSLETLFGLFQQMPEWAQSVALGTYSIGKAIEPVLISLASLVTILGATGLGGALSGAGSAIASFGAVVLEGLGASLSFIGGALLGAGEAIAAFVAGLIGWPAVIIAAIAALAAGIYFYWDEIVAFLKKATEKITAFLTVDLPAAFKSVINTVANWYYQMKFWLQDQLGGLIDEISKDPEKIVDAFKWMFNSVVGFSYVPDMVDGIAAEFARLDRVMIDPALAAVDQVNAAFADGMGPTLSSSAAGAGWSAGGGGGAVTVTVNMSGMFSTDDPQTRSMVSDLVSSAVMQGMRGGRLLGTA